MTTTHGDDDDDGDGDDDGEYGGDDNDECDGDEDDENDDGDDDFSHIQQLAGPLYIRCMFAPLLATGWTSAQPGDASLSESSSCTDFSRLLDR